MALKLSEGSMMRILNGEVIDRPVLQILGYKKIPGNPNNERYRLMISDGSICHPFAMLATQLNDKIVKGELERFTVIQLDKYLCNQVQPDKKVLILLELTVLVSGVDVGEKIGTPVQPSINVNSNNNEMSAASYQPPQPNQNRNFGIHGSISATIPKPEDGASILRQATVPGRFGQQPMQTQGPNSSNINIHPIVSLTPYQNRWTIRARVTNKTEVRKWSNSRGEGKFFSMDLIDESGEIRATAFNEQCERFFDMIEINKVYYISKATLKTANKKFTSIKNDYEMTFNGETTVIPCAESSASIPMLQFDFITISQLQSLEKDKLVDVIGICKNATDVQTLTSRTTNQELKKRDITLVDKTGTEVTLTLWGDQAERFNGCDNPVLAVKGARVTDFGGKSLSLLTNSALQINPDIQEAHILRGWYDREGSTMPTQSLSTQSSAMGGYGNVAPKTPWGKVVTVIYAIIGIPLLLLCLSNIGDVMAHSFKFLYWKVCCYLCIKPKRKRKVTYKHTQYPSAKFSSSGGETEFKNSPPGTPKTPKAADDLSSSSYYTAPESPLSPEVSFKPNFKFDPPDACSIAVITNKYVMQNCEDSFCRPEYNIPVTVKDIKENSRRWEVMDVRQGDDSDLEQEEITVPIILCVLLVIGCICGGAILFSLWEDWDFLDSSYFCFVTLTTIGFGDLVPGSAVVSDDNQLTLGLCSLYLMLGMALLAMSFNLVQEEVIKTVKSIGKRIGILSSDDDDDDEDDN